MDNLQHVENGASMTDGANQAGRIARNAVRAGAVTAATALTLLLSSPAASALIRDDGDDPGPGLSVAETLGLYVVAPVVLFLVITGLVVASDRSRKNDG